MRVTSHTRCLVCPSHGVPGPCIQMYSLSNRIFSKACPSTGPLQPAPLIRKWGDQVISSTSKATKVLNILHRNTHGHKNTKKRAYQALVWPLLEFSVPVWSPYQWKDAYIRTRESPETSNTLDICASCMGPVNILLGQCPMKTAAKSCVGHPCNLEGIY